MSLSGELLLRCARTWSGPKKTLAAYFGACWVFVCPHMGVDVREDQLGCHRYEIGDGKDHAHHRVCTKCGAECEIRLGRGTGNVEVEGRRQTWFFFPPAWTVTTTTYYNVGTCRAPRDPKWLAAFYEAEPQYEVAWGAAEALWNSSPA